MTIKEDTPDIDSVEILLQYMDEFKHSGQNRAAAKLIRSLMASAPLVEAQDHIPDAGKMVYEIKLIASMLSLTISDAEPSRMRDVCIDVKNDLYRVIAQPVAVSDNNELVRLQTAIEHVRQQAGIWKQEARTQGGIVRRILETLGLPTNDWEAETNVATLAGQVAPQATVELTDELNLIYSILDGFQTSIARADGMNAVKRIRALLATPPTSKATQEIANVTDELDCMNRNYQALLIEHNALKATSKADTGEAALAAALSEARIALVDIRMNGAGARLITNDITAIDEALKSATPSVPPKTLVDPEPIYKVLMEAKLALCAVNSGASAHAIGLIDGVLNATPSTIKAEPTGGQQ